MIKNMIFLIILLIVIVFPTIAKETIILQQGVDEYNGCKSTYLYNEMSDTSTSGYRALDGNEIFNKDAAKFALADFRC